VAGGASVLIAHIELAAAIVPSQCPAFFGEFLLSAFQLYPNFHSSPQPPNFAALEPWLHQNAIEQAMAYTDLISKKGTKLEDIAKAATQVRPDAGLDSFMESIGLTLRADCTAQDFLDAYCS